MHTAPVVDSGDMAGADDPACRPNQLLAISLAHPVLQPRRWASVVTVARDKLLTPVGLRSLSPDDPNFKPTYHGDLKTRDAAYHQGTVWAWLIGPFIDAWLKVYPDDRQGARRLLDGFISHFGQEACVGSISEVFDAVEPFTARGCIAQAWSVAEVLRCWAMTADHGPTGTGGSHSPLSSPVNPSASPPGVPPLRSGPSGDGSETGGGGLIEFISRAGLSSLNLREARHGSASVHPEAEQFEAGTERAPVGEQAVS